MSRTTCDECKRNSATTKPRSQGGGKLCDVCFKHLNELNNLAAENLRLKGKLERPAFVPPTATGAYFPTTAYYFLNNNLQIQHTTTGTAASNFMVPNWVIDQLLDDLKRQDGSLIELARISRELQIAETQLDRLHQRLFDLQVVARAAQTAKNKSKSDATRLQGCAGSLLPPFPIQRCEINICAENDPSCHCNFMLVCDLVARDLISLADTMSDRQDLLDDLFSQILAY